MAKCFILILAAAILLTTTTAFPFPSTSTSTSPSPSPAAGTENSTTPTAYEMLERYSFPVGILPDGAQRYELHPDGSFEVRFPADCNFSIAKLYTVHYSSRVAGSIKNGTISGLEGVKVKLLFSWIGITEVSRDGDELTFHVDSFSKSFPVDKFSISPHCR